MRIGVIMAGGVGERFWPYSRKDRPKQLLRIVGEQTLLEEALRRISPIIPPQRQFIVTNERLKNLILQQIPDFPEANIICEPIGRNTAACLALTEVVTSARFSNPTMAVLTADHIIRDTDTFLKNIDAACRFAEDTKSLVTLGIQPTRPETGFGYIEVGEMVRDEPNGVVFRASRFREKPDIETAKRFLSAGNFYWNSGMFFWKNSVLRANLEKFLPETMEGMRIYRDAIGTPEEKTALRRVFERLPNVSIDYALMEKADNVYVLRADFVWDDLGTWNAIERCLQKDKDGNLVIGQGAVCDTTDTLIYNVGGKDGQLVAAFGLKDTLIVVDKDAILVCPKHLAPELKKLVAELKKRNLEEYL